MTTNIYLSIQLAVILFFAIGSILTRKKSKKSQYTVRILFAILMVIAILLQDFNVLKV